MYAFCGGDGPRCAFYTLLRTAPSGSPDKDHHQHRFIGYRDVLAVCLELQAVPVEVIPVHLESDEFLDQSVFDIGRHPVVHPGVQLVGLQKGGSLTRSHIDHIHGNPELVPANQHVRGPCKGHWQAICDNF